VNIGQESYTMKRRFGAGIATLALAGTIVAGAAGSAFAGPLSSKEFKRQANAICAAGNQQIEAAAEQIFAGLSEDQQPSPDQLAAFAAVVIPSIKQQVEEVAALEEPKSLQAKVRKLIRTARAAVAKVEANPSLLTDEESDPFASTDKQLRKLGLKECASDEES
jgi:type IV secretory pathway TrbL component